MKLNEATKARQAEPETFCPTLSVSGVTCLIFPANFGVSPELRVRVKGRETFVRVGGMVHDALESLGPGAEAPTTLQVRRFFRGQLMPVRFDSSSEDILRLELMPGDEITW
jgi:hypothetical protein